MRFISERPYLISLMLIILVALWLFVPISPDESNQDTTEAPKRPLQKVQVRHLSSQSTELELVFTGRTEPNKKALIASELNGLLVGYQAERGSRVIKGDSIAEISTGSLNAALAGAKAEQRSAAAQCGGQPLALRERPAAGKWKQEGLGCLAAGAEGEHAHVACAFGFGFLQSLNHMTSKTMFEVITI